MVLNFRTKSLTIADHAYLSAWLEESEANQQLFEKWIFEHRPVTASSQTRFTGTQPVAASRGVSHPVLIPVVVALIIVVLLFILLR